MDGVEVVEAIRAAQPFGAMLLAGWGMYLTLRAWACWVKFGVRTPGRV